MNPISIPVHHKPLPLTVMIACLFSVATPALAQDNNGGTLTYRNDRGFVGLGVDESGNITGEVKYLLSGGATAGTVGELWAGNGSGGLKLSYNWIPAMADGKPDANKAIRKIFGAVDQNAMDDRKLTLGAGLENGKGQLAGYLSHALTGSRQLATQYLTSTATVNGNDSSGRPYIDTTTNLTTISAYEHPFDWGAGVRAGRYVSQYGLQLGIGADYEWGKGSAQQTTVSLNADKYFQASPWSISLKAEALTSENGLAGRAHDVRSWLMLRYAFGNAPRTPLTYPAPAHLSAPARQATATPVSTPTTSSQAAGATQAKTVEAAAPTEQTEKRLVKTTASMTADTFFKFDSATLNSAANQELNKVIGLLSNQGYANPITLTGHTCNIGTEAYNMKLSTRRAESVKKYLVNQGHIPQGDIIAVGKGERDPAYPNTPATRYKNRRVDLEFLTYVTKEEQVLVPVPATRQAATENTNVAAVQPPAKEPAIIWQSEIVEPEPAWIQHGLFDTIAHKRTVDYYRVVTQTVTTATERAFVNRNPVANNDNYSVQNGLAMTMAVLANDSDPDNDVLSIASVTQPALGRVAISGSAIVYTPNSTAINGTDSFTYTVSDGKGGTAIASVSVTIAANQTPVAANDRYVLSGFSTRQLDVLVNDYDPDGDPLNIVSFSQPNQGTVTQSGNTLFFSHSTLFSLTTFSYTISDGLGGTSSAVVTVVDP